MMQYKTLLPAAGLLLLAGCAASPSRSLGTADNSFIMQAASGGISEVMLGKMAQQKGTSLAVRRFGTEMVSDHVDPDKELVKIATSKGTTPPAGPDASHSAVATQLAGLIGTAFDQQYLNAQVQDHQLQVQLYTAEAQSGTDPDLKAFAAKNLPMLQDHLQKAQSALSTVTTASSAPAG